MTLSLHSVNPQVSLLCNRHKSVLCHVVPIYLRFLNQTRLFVGHKNKAKEPVPCAVLYDSPLYEACSFGTMDEAGGGVRGCLKLDPLFGDGFSPFLDGENRCQKSWFNLRPIQVLVVYHRDLRKPLPGRKMLNGLIPTFESSQVGDSCDPAAQV